MKFCVCFVLIILRAKLCVAEEKQTKSNERNVPSNVNEIKSLIIDTDAGSDDGVAILNILGAEDLFHEIEVKLITAVRGNTHVDNVGKNILKILKTANRLDIPVYKGANKSILITPKLENYFGEDGFGDFVFPNPPSEDLIKNENAVNALVDTVSQNPGKLTLVCLGPLTNIGLAIKLNSNFLSNLKEIFVLGGSDSGLGNIKPGVEFNIYSDPEAAFIVFNEAEEKNLVINLLTWETPYLRSTVDMEWRTNILGTIKSPQIDLINKAEKMTLKGDLWISADALLSSVIINRTIVKSSNDYHVDIEVCGRHSRAALLVDYEETQKLPKNARIIKEVDVAKFKQMLLQNLNPHGGYSSGAARSV